MYSAHSNAPSASVTGCQSEQQFWLKEGAWKDVSLLMCWISGASKGPCSVEDGVRDRINSTHDFTYSAVIGSL